MPTYKIYHVAEGGRLRVGNTFLAEDDDEAVAQAWPQLMRGQAAELWEWGRPVGRFSRDHEFIPNSG